MSWRGNSPSRWAILTLPIVWSHALRRTTLRWSTLAIRGFVVKRNGWGQGLPTSACTMRLPGQSVESIPSSGLFFLLGLAELLLVLMHAFVRSFLLDDDRSLHPNDKQAQNAYFNRLVSAAALPKTTFQQGIRDLVGLLSKQREEVATTTPSSASSRSTTKSAADSVPSTPSRGGAGGGPSSGVRTPTSRSSRLQHPPSNRASAHQTPASAQASAKKLLDPKFLATLRSCSSSGGDPSTAAAEEEPSDSPLRTPTRRGIHPTTSLTPGTRNASATHKTPSRSSATRSATPRATLPRTSTVLAADATTPTKTRTTSARCSTTAPSTHQEAVVPSSEGEEEQPATPTTALARRPPPPQASKSTGKRKALPSEEQDDNPFVDDAEAADRDHVDPVRTATPRKKARFTALLRETQADDEPEFEPPPQPEREEEHDSEREPPRPPAPHRAGAAKHHHPAALYAPSFFRVPLSSDLDPEVSSAATATEDDPTVHNVRQSFVSTLLPFSLVVPRGAGRAPRARPTPVLSISTAEWLAPWQDGLAVGRERFQAGFPGWMARMEYGGTSLPAAARPDLQAWLVQDGP